ncbi:Hypothetical predicted protein [Pelobates cultripes]|uniref:Ferric-chelate reductase 1 n=1 Tax=Pelobates cultripes TaxID=61616 RepID=A0AAD1SUH0_PELCU|nr:Hypothetical predicted protein [Pelobates cultripes]
MMTLYIFFYKLEFLMLQLSPVHLTMKPNQLTESEMKLVYFGLLFFGLLFAHVTCYSSGLVTVACDTMLPRHGNNSVQTTVPPYTVSASNYSFSPGDNITVTLKANSDIVFKGFFLQARTVSGNNTVGYFTVTNSTIQTLDCGGTVKSAVSHTSSINKSSISVLWTAPFTAENVHFRATFVQSRSVFWAEVESPVLTMMSSTSQPNSSSTASPTLISSTQNIASGPPPTSISSSSCGIEKVCFSSPSNCDPATSHNCFFMSSALASGGGYKFEISGPSAGYVSFGFSDDQVMGNDDIYICGMDSVGGIGIQHAYSEGQSRPLTLNLSNVEVNLASFTSGVIQCSFISRNSISTQYPVQQSKSINSSYYILMAYGDSSNGRIQYHGMSGTFISSSKIDPSVATNVTVSSSNSQDLVNAHGCLMLIAWMTTGTLGMVFARYMKVAAKKMIFGKAAWFQAHIFLMFLTVAATITSFVLAFVNAMGWAYGANSHSIIGCIVMILAFFQPIIAIFRPSPQSNWRSIFNWFHALNAFVTYVLAVANLFLGMQLINGNSGWMVKVMGGFLGWVALNVIFFEINAFLARKDLKKAVDNDNQISVKYELFILPFYMCGNLAFLIALLVGIGQS